MSQPKDVSVDADEGTARGTRLKQVVSDMRARADEYRAYRPNVACQCEPSWHAEEIERWVDDLVAALAPAEGHQTPADEDAARTVRSIAAMLGWMNVPPLRVLEADIRALKARAEGPTRTDAPVIAPSERIAKMENTLRLFAPGSHDGWWGRIKAWIVNGATTRDEGIAAARQITEWQCAVDDALADSGETAPAWQPLEQLLADYRAAEALDWYWLDEIENRIGKERYRQIMSAPLPSPPTPSKEDK